MKQMNTDEVWNRTLINTTWVKKAGGGTCNVPSTEEAHEVKRLLCDLYDHERNRDKRISKLEGGIVASADALADLEYRHLKRIEALEAHDKCQNCAVSPYIEAEKKTCGECKRPWSRQGWGDPKSWVLLCEYETGENGEYRVRDHSQPACDYFEATP